MNQGFHIYFTKSQYIATLSFTPVGNHQATDSKKNKFTIIVLASADPYLPDQVEFKHTSLLNLRQDAMLCKRIEKRNSILNRIVMANFDFYGTEMDF